MKNNIVVDPYPHSYELMYPDRYPTIPVITYWLSQKSNRSVPESALMTSPTIWISHLEHEGARELVENSVRVVVRGGGHIAQSLPCTGSQHHGTSATGAITKYPCYLDVKA